MTVLKRASTEDGYWEKVIEEARAYPGGVLNYCRNKKISKSRLYLQFRRLRVDHPEWNERPGSKISRAKKSRRSVLIPVKLATKSAEPSESVVEHIELRLRSGHVLILPVSYRGDQLAQMIRGLEA